MVKVSVVGVKVMVVDWEKSVRGLLVGMLCYDLNGGFLNLPREWTSWMPMLEQRLDTLNEQSNSQAVVRTSLDVKARSCECCCSSGLLNLARRTLAFWRS